MQCCVTSQTKQLRHHGFALCFAVWTACCEGSRLPCCVGPSAAVGRPTERGTEVWATIHLHFMNSFGKDLPVSLGKLLWKGPSCFTGEAIMEGPSCFTGEGFVERVFLLHWGSYYGKDLSVTETRVGKTAPTISQEVKKGPASYNPPQCHPSRT